MLTKFCKSCSYWNKKKSTPGYQNWKINHVCEANHIKSSMEASGAVSIFQRSIEKHGLRYAGYIRDGDSSAYNDVVASNPYPGFEINRLHCLGHYQKRLGNRACNLRVTLKGQFLSDGKKIDGKGQLTDKAINTLQNYFGMAIHQNVNNLYAMKKGAWAVLFHNSDISEESERHKFCPRTRTSWCLWQSNKVTGETAYKTKLSLPLAIKAVLMPIYTDLTNETLLSKCLHRQTQNNNESLNALIWKRCPKDFFIGKKVLEISMNSAIIAFNDGSTAVDKVISAGGIEPSIFMQEGLRKLDCNQIKKMNHKSSAKGKIRRKQLRAIKKGYIDIEKELEKDPQYNSGGF